MARARWISNDNDRGLDARDLLRQEFALANHGRSIGIPTPAMYHLDLEGDLLVSQFMESDTGQSAPSQLGTIIGRLHQAPPPPIRCVGQRGQSAASTVTNLLRERLGTIGRLTRHDLPDVDQVQVHAHLRSREGYRALLHMDARSANVLVKNGQIVALLDWSNALVGDPWLELCRIAEYGEVGSEFWTNYKLAAHDLAGRSRPDTAIELLYRLYTATMMTIVFLSEAPDPLLGSRWFERTVQLLDEYRWRAHALQS